MVISIDWGEVSTEIEFFEIFLPQVKAPNWHGRNLNALADSIVTGDINGTEPPYTICNIGTESVSGNIKSFQVEVFEIFQEARDAGREINVIYQEKT